MVVIRRMSSECIGGSHRARLMASHNRRPAGEPRVISALLFLFLRGCSAATFDGADYGKTAGSLHDGSGVGNCSTVSRTPTIFVARS